MELSLHYRAAIVSLFDGNLVPFLGAGINLCDRPAGLQWTAGQSEYLPSGYELSQYLAQEFPCPVQDVANLAHVSQRIEVLLGSGPLYDRLRAIFAKDYPLTSAHAFVARLSRDVRAEAHRFRIGPQLIVTTNYDDLLEQAFTRENEPFHLLTYLADGPHRGRFVHTAPDGSRCVVERPNEYDRVSNGTVLLKIHGAVHKQESAEDSYVITEDDYIDYLSRVDLASLVPAPVLAKLRYCHFLFLGYGLRDWNLRVILHRIAMDRSRSYQSWAVQRNPEPLDQQFWLMRRVELLNVHLRAYIDGFERAIEAYIKEGHCR